MSREIMLERRPGYVDGGHPLLFLRLQQTQHGKVGRRGIVGLRLVEFRRMWKG